MSFSHTYIQKWTELLVHFRKQLISHQLIFSKCLFIVTFVIFKLFQGPLWVFLSLTEGYQQFCIYIYTCSTFKHADIDPCSYQNCL